MHSSYISKSGIRGVLLSFGLPIPLLVCITATAHYTGLLSRECFWFDHRPTVAPGCLFSSVFCWRATLHADAYTTCQTRNQQRAVWRLIQIASLYSLRHRPIYIITGLMTAMSVYHEDYILFCHFGSNTELLLQALSGTTSRTVKAEVN